MRDDRPRKLYFLHGIQSLMLSHGQVPSAHPFWRLKEQEGTERTEKWISSSLVFSVINGGKVSWLIIWRDVIGEAENEGACGAFVFSS